jgi:hypothetical protein
MILKFVAIWSIFKKKITFSDLTLIVLGEVKVDLTDFDIKLWEYLLRTFLYLSLQNLVQIFFTSYTTSKEGRFDIHFNYITSKVRLWPHPSAQFNCCFRPKGGEKSRYSLVCSLAWHQSGFHSVSSPLPCRVGGGGRSSVRSAL